MDFSSLKRSSQTDFDALKAKVNETASGGGFKKDDENFWKPDVTPQVMDMPLSDSFLPLQKRTCLTCKCGIMDSKELEVGTLRSL